jgi:PPOX class probable F420-dependent enzyme
MALSDSQLAFLEENHSAAMVTVGGDGIPKAVRVGVALVDGRLWSSSRDGSVRARRLGRDPHCTLFVFDSRFSYLTLETTVTTIEQPGSVDASVALFRSMQRRPEGPLAWYGTELAEDDFRRRMVEEGRIVFEFDVHRAYGLV